MPSPARPIFIVSAMGSGSTLLRLILDSHERIGIPQETGFMRAYNAQQFVPFKHSGRNWARRMGWTRAELDAELAQFYERMFTRYIERHGKQRWGDKTPLHTWHVDAMLRLFPKAVFIGMMRHPGGSVGSNMRRFNHSCRHAAQYVARYDREIARQAAVHQDRFVVVRYEDLVLRSEPLLRELLDWLGEPWSDHVLEHHEVQTARGGKLIVEGTSRIDDPIDVSRIDKWWRMMSERQREIVGAELGRICEFFGYDAADPAVLAPLGSNGSLLISGADVDARIDEFADLNLREKGEPSLAERFYNPRRIQLRAVGELAAQAGPPPELPVIVRIWHVLPYRTRLRLRPLSRLGKRALRAWRERKRG
jgi:hypothetical protein